MAKNNHVYLSPDKHYYSVPYAYIGIKAKVIYTRTMVRIYAKGEQIAVHARDHGHGKNSTVKEHLCSHHRHYLDRSPAYYISIAGQKSATLTRLFHLIFETGKHPEVQYRSCDGLLSLCRKTGEDIFNRACQSAIDNNEYSYRFIRNIIDNKMIPENIEDKTCNLPVPDENKRGKQYFEHAIQTEIEFYNTK